MPIQISYFKKTCSSHLDIGVAAVVAISCIDWLLHAIVSFIDRSHLPSATEKTLALIRNDHARS